jgi:AAA+ ATPase superfamily predicted ATPase
MKFIYGPPVQEDDFVNRVEEIKRLTSIIESFDYSSPVHIEISAPRRIGKTSLILEVGRRLKESGYRFINIDLLSFHNITAAVEEIRNKVIESLPYTQAAIKMFAGYLKNIRLGMPKKLSVSDKGITVDVMDNIFSLYKPSWKETLTELFTFLRNNRDRRFVISLDEIGFIRNVKDREDAQEVFILSGKGAVP